MKIVTYIQEAYKELIHKVTWPSWNDLQSSSIIVMIASVIFAVIVFVMDISFDNLMNLLYKMLGGY